MLHDRLALRVGGHCPAEVPLCRLDVTDLLQAHREVALPARVGRVRRGQALPNRLALLVGGQCPAQVALCCKRVATVVESHRPPALHLAVIHVDPEVLVIGIDPGIEVLEQVQSADGLELVTQVDEHELDQPLRLAAGQVRTAALPLGGLEHDQGQDQQQHHGRQAILDPSWQPPAPVPERGLGQGVVAQLIEEPLQPRLGTQQPGVHQALEGLGSDPELVADLGLIHRQPAPVLAQEPPLAEVTGAPALAPARQGGQGVAVEPGQDGGHALDAAQVRGLDADLGRALGLARRLALEMAAQDLELEGFDDVALAFKEVQEPGQGVRAEGERRARQVLALGQAGGLADGGAGGLPVQRGEAQPVLQHGRNLRG